MKAQGRQWVWAIAALLLFALAFQGSRALFAPDEGRYTAVALEMLSSGDWIHPRLHQEVPHYTKPPLTYWMLATALNLGGSNEWAARAPNALLFSASVWMLSTPVGGVLAPTLTVTVAVLLRPEGSVMV